MAEERTADLKAYKLYTLTELEDVLGVTHRTLLKYVYTGKLPAKKIAGRYRVTESDLQAFLQGEEPGQNEKH